jgi:cytochrome c oxidase subunit 2
MVLATAPTFVSQGWADSGHSHGRKKVPGGQGAEKALRGHEMAEPAHGHEMETAPHEHKKKESAHGHGKEEAPQGHEEKEGAQGHGADSNGHAAHNHGAGAFKKYGLVKADKGFKEYNLKLSQFRFTPNTMRVDVGDRVRLNLDSVDVTHGFYIDGYGLKTLVPEKENKTIEFVANRSGAYRIRCASTCGPFHPFMIGRLIVGQSNFFWWGLTATVVLPVGALIAFDWKEKKTHEG